MEVLEKRGIKTDQEMRISPEDVLISTEFEPLPLIYLPPSFARARLESKSPDEVETLAVKSAFSGTFSLISPDEDEATVSAGISLRSRVISPLEVEALTKSACSAFISISPDEDEAFMEDAEPF